MYSQNKEDDFVKALFNEKMPGYVGALISIGENDGMTLSNSLLFIENGWSGLLVEPSTHCFDKLKELHKNSGKVVLENCCIGSKNSVVRFFESSSLLGTGDHGLVSTVDENEMKRWGNTTTFTPYSVNMITVDELLEKHQYNTADYVSIDAEGLDLEIFSQFNFSLLNSKVVIVEWNGKNKDQFDEHAKLHNLHLVHKNAENLIYSIWP